MLTPFLNAMAYRDEKSVFLSQISTLQGQQAALGSRLESLTEAADNAMAREREAEDRLDSASGELLEFERVVPRCMRHAISLSTVYVF
jgi:hypothetical protein